MRKIHDHFAKSSLFLLTIPLALILLGFAAYQAPRVGESSCNGWKVSNTGNIHGQNSYWFPIVSGPCYPTYEEALEVSR